MDESQTGLLIFGLIALVSAVVWHAFISEFGKAVIGATITAVVVFQFAAYLHLGYLDPFFIIAVVISGAASLGIAAVVGLLFRFIRGMLSDKP